MRFGFAFFLTWSCALASSFAAAPSPPTVEYDLAVRVEPAEAQIFGEGRLRFTNTTSAAFDGLCFHAYLNAFRSDDSTFMRELARDGRAPELEPRERGFTELLSLQRSGEGAELLAAARYIAPDDANRRDRTVLEVPLEETLAPGKTLELRLSFVSRLPKPIARAGAAGEFMMASQWFPKLGVPEGGPGEAHGRWRCAQYHALGEFHAPFGRYRVAIDVPAGFEVVATGPRVASERRGDRIRHVHEQDGIHDFAFAVDRHSLRIERRYVAAQEVEERRVEAAARRLGVPASALRPTDLTVILLIRPERAFAVERYLAATFHALTELSLRHGPYPYSVLTVIDPPRGAEETGGMEYPTLITGGARFGAPPEMPVPESVTLHEVGHQFFYGLLGSDEVQEAWLDEGLTSYATLRNYEAAYGGRLRFAPSVLGVPLSPWFVHDFSFRDVERTRFLIAPDQDPTILPSWMFRDLSSYRVGVYARPVLFFIRLEQWLGVDRLDRALFRYVERHRFTAPTSRDLLDAIEAEHGGPLPDWITAPLFRAGGLELAVAELRSEVRPPSSGIESVRMEEGKLISTVQTASSAGEHLTSVLVERRGELMRPAELHLTLEDGQVLKRAIEGPRRWWRVEHLGPRAVKAELFPGANDPLNQTEIHRGRTRAPRFEPGIVFAGHAAYLQALLLDLLGALL